MTFITYLFKVHRFSLFQTYCGFHVILQGMIFKLTYTQSFQIYDYNQGSSKVYNLIL